jgi:acetyltransferase
MPIPGAISIISQSGALCAAMLDQAAARHLGLAKLISIGNKTDISEVDLLKYLANDPQTKVIIAYLEEISSGDYFVKAAETASAKKPVIIMKSATTAAGRRAAASHTGMLLGSETAYGAAFKRAGVIKADTFHAMFDYAALFAMQPLSKGKRVVVITNSGGGGAIAADAVEQAGLEVTKLHVGETTFHQAGILPDKNTADSGNNPIDVPDDADPDRYTATIKAAQQDDKIDTIAVIIAPQTMSKPRETVKAIGAALDGSKPAVVALLGTYDTAPGPAELAALNLPDYDAPERAIGAIRAMHEYWLWKNRPPRRVTRFRVNRRKVERIIRRHQQTSRLFLGEVRAKDILRAYGFNTPVGSLASANEEAVELAQRFGFPVAMKFVSPNIIHKTDLGGVKLNLASSAQVEDAYDLMMMRIRQKVPDAVIEGVFVEKMAAKGLEVIIGMHRDRQFGPMLMFGLGGIFVEVMKDVTFHLAPITEGEAIQMLKATRSYEMLQGKRGSKGVDINAIANCMQRISQLTTDFPQIRELDINPLIVSDEQSNPVVVDARITLAPIKENQEGTK